MTTQFSHPAYRLLHPLSRNHSAGRVTHLAKHIDTAELVVIKAIPLGWGGSSWPEAKRIEREIQLLKGLQHPDIPRYLESFQERDTIYLVQEYIDAPNLTQRYSFRPEEIKTIAVRLLQILVYLQSHIPPVVHGDIKPENILLKPDHQGVLKLYLVDFGLARTSAETPSSDSAGMGTFGFIPPEQMRRQLTRASDLYAVGATLICLLSGTTTQHIHTLTHPDEPHRFEFRERLLNIDAHLSPRFLDWLERMVEPNLKDRFQDAYTALQALEPLQVVARAQICLDTSEIHLQAETLGPPLNATLHIFNSTPDTLLQGRCSVMTPPYDDGTWIHLHPVYFKQNQAAIQLSIDTRCLLANTTYRRKLIIESNGEQAVMTIPLYIQTPVLQPPRHSWPLGRLALLLGASMLFPFTIAVAIFVIER